MAYGQEKYINSLQGVMLDETVQHDPHFKRCVETIALDVQQNIRKPKGLHPFHKKCLELYSNELQMLASVHALSSVMEKATMLMHYALVKNSCYDLMHLARNVEFAIRYWTYEHHEEQKRFYNKNILRWFHRSSYDHQATINLEQLKALREDMFYLLGAMLTTQKKYEQARDYDQCKQVFADAMVFYHDYYQLDAQFSLDFHSLVHVQSAVLEHVDGLDKQYCTHSAPSHITRNWFKYTLGAAAVGGAAWFTYRNYENFDQWLEKGKERVNRFYVDHVQDPVQKIKKSLFEEEKPKILTPDLVAFNDTVGPIAEVNELDRRAAQNQLREMYKHEIIEKIKSDQGWRALFSKYPTDEEIEKMMQNKELLQELDVEHLKAFLFSPNAAIRAVTRQALVLKEEGYDVLDGVVKTVRNIEKNLELGKIKTNINALMTTVQQMITTLEEERQDQKLNLQIAALLPAILLVYGAGSACIAGYNKLFKKNFAHNPMKRAIRKIEMVLNESLDKEKDFFVEGQLHFYIHALGDFMSIVSSEQEVRFYQDIAELERDDLSYQQKYNVIQRMYHTYYFLLPGTV